MNKKGSTIEMKIESETGRERKTERQNRDQKFNRLFHRPILLVWLT